MPSDVPEDTLPEDTSFTESAMLEPDSPKIADGERQYKEEGALVIPVEAKVGENLIIDVKASIQRRAAPSTDNEHESKDPTMNHS